MKRSAGALPSRRGFPERAVRTSAAEPIVIQPLCVACHGASLSPDLSDAVRAKYPRDQATGYQVGDLRGVAWAEIASAPAVPAR